jgi:hypothetical protein
MSALSSSPDCYGYRCDLEQQAIMPFWRVPEYGEANACVGLASGQ